MDSGSSAPEDTEPEYKIIVVGNGTVGKTSLIRRYCEDGFGQGYKQTIGVDFYSKKVEIPGSQAVSLQIWDIGGQQIGGTMIANYVHGADAVCLVYDVTNPASFKDVEDWRQSLLALQGNEEGRKPLMVLVGNKTDLPNRQVTADMHAKAASAYDMESILISARSGDRVNALFVMIAAKLAGVDISQQELDMTNRVVLSIDSRLQERTQGLRATEGKEKRKSSNDNCCLM
ncbi:putative small GTP-binding protein Rab28 [Trypanosoma cruzi]|nr:putative small GTP-binding protein Rab28 [Trypanosoma cruzi]PBJ80785.1 small GTP-binding protein Rab28 [Trypanosoma cruzi cruzi]RNF22164.1 putative small GTP-binding protein Rab28 [Trypanosoma cruzi]